MPVADFKSFWIKYKDILLYGCSMAACMFLLNWMELRFVVYDHAFELFIGCIALLFTALGIWLALKLSKPKVQTIIIEKEIPVLSTDHFVPDEAAIRRLDLSKREVEVLGLMAKGLSNQEIANTLFISLSTIKTHNQSLFVKLDVKRRTQAIERARALRVIP